MTIRRFVNEHGWEKWIDVQDPPPRVVRIPDPVTLSRRSVADVPMRAERSGIRDFHLQEWEVEGGPHELVYTEDGHMLEDADRFGPDRPSLHRERYVRGNYTSLLARLRNVIEQKRMPGQVIGQMLVATHVLDEVESLLREHEYEVRSGKGSKHE